MFDFYRQALLRPSIENLTNVTFPAATKTRPFLVVDLASLGRTFFNGIESTGSCSDGSKK